MSFDDFMNSDSDAFNTHSVVNQKDSCADWVDLETESLSKQPVDIPLGDQNFEEENCKSYDEKKFISPRTPPFTPTGQVSFFLEKNKVNHTENNDLLSKTPEKDNIMSELSKLLTDKLSEPFLSPTLLSPNSSSSSLHSLSQKSLLRKSQAVPWTDKQSPGSDKKGVYNKHELSPSSSNYTLTRDEDGNDSIHEEDVNPNLFLKIDEIDGLPLTASPKDIHKLQENDHKSLSPTSSFRQLAHFPIPEKQENNDEELKLHHHKKISLTMNDKDYNLPVPPRLDDELKKRAQQINSAIENEANNDARKDNDDFKPINKALLEWEYKTFNGFAFELNNWFFLLEGNMQKHDLIDELIWVIKEQKEEITDIKMDVLKFNDFELIFNILHKSLGNFVGLCIEDETFLNDQSLELEYLVKNVLINNFELMDQHAVSVISFLKQHMTLVMTENDRNVVAYNKLLKISTTIFYTMLCSCLAYLDKTNPKTANQDISRSINNFRNAIDESELLSFIMDYIENWRFTFKVGMQIRQLLAIFDKLLILQFGDEKEAFDTQVELNKTANSEYKSNASNSILNVAQYEALRQDLITRYPDLTDKIEVLEDYKYDFSDSTSQYINVPRPKKDYLANMAANGKNVMQFDNNTVPNIQIIGSVESSVYGTPRSSFSNHLGNINSLKKVSNQTNLNIPFFPPSESNILVQNAFKDSLAILEANKKLRDYNSLQLSFNKLKFFCKEMQLDYCQLKDSPTRFIEDPVGFKNLERIEKFYASNFKKFKSLVVVLNKILLNFQIDEELNLLLISTCLSIILHLLERLKLQHVLKYEYFSSILFSTKFIEISTGLLDSTYASTDRFKKIFYYDESFYFWDYLCKFLCFDDICKKKNHDINVFKKSKSINKTSVYNIDIKRSNCSEDLNLNYLDFEYALLESLNLVISERTQRLKFLPLNIGVLFKKTYQIYNKTLYKPVLELVKQLTPFKSKKWKSEHMELITGVYMHLHLNTLDNNWVTGKDTNGEIIDSLNIEVAMSELVKFYNKSNYDS